MSDRFRLTLAQLNPTLGDLAGNAAKACHAWAQAKAEGADMVALPEMFLSGYQTQDLVQRPAFLDDLRTILDQLAHDCADGPMIGIGLPMAENGAIYNCWAVLGGGNLRAVIRKHHLPNEHVFDEKRIFTSGDI
jgi:NAD+ synthase